ncbi:hypothetical protein HAX54_038265 [Datura stramonium]|uniref:Uncharacterized protein n=1 Tax=Datura stramonium TaxID=4076 RepID=A0ABS8VLU6_DATST|nr:hypothetical protein [Datura stramonium]
MELDSIECISSSDGIDDDEIPLHHPHIIHSQYSSSKTPNNNTINNSSSNNDAIAIHSTTSVHELLECPVCTNSMYPPIHQANFLDLSTRLTAFITRRFRSTNLFPLVNDLQAF